MTSFLLSIRWVLITPIRLLICSICISIGLILLQCGFCRRWDHCQLVIYVFCVISGWCYYVGYVCICTGLVQRHLQKVIVIGWFTELGLWVFTATLDFFNHTFIALDTFLTFTDLTLSSTKLGQTCLLQRSATAIAHHDLGHALVCVEIYLFGACLQDSLLNRVP